jgi:hypothetical protein
MAAFPVLAVGGCLPKACVTWLPSRCLRLVAIVAALKEDQVVRIDAVVLVLSAASTAVAAP